MGSNPIPSANFRLRFDKVALRLIQGVRQFLADAVPDGVGVVFTVTAPIREPARTTAAIVAAIRDRLPLGPMPGSHVATCHGNLVRIRVVSAPSPHAARVAGFVHNPDPPPDPLLDAAQALLQGHATDCGTALNAATLRHIRAQVLAPPAAPVRNDSES